MAVRIRLRRTGKRNAPAHRIVVADARSPRDGRFIENLGFYDPRRKIVWIDLERYNYWISQGAQPSATVDAIAKRSRAGIAFGGKKEEAQAETPVEAPAPAEPESEESAPAEEPEPSAE